MHSNVPVFFFFRVHSAGEIVFAEHIKGSDNNEWWDNFLKIRHQFRAGGIYNLLRLPLFGVVGASSVDSRHQLPLLPLRKEQNSDNKQINNTCSGADKAVGELRLMRPRWKEAERREKRVFVGSAAPRGADRRLFFSWSATRWCSSHPKLQLFRRIRRRAKRG